MREKHLEQLRQVLSKPLDAKPGALGIGKRLRYARALRAASAKDLGFFRQSISQIESGKQIPRVDLIEKLANGLKVRVEWLAHGTGEMEDDKCLAD